MTIDAIKCPYCKSTIGTCFSDNALSPKLTLCPDCRLYFNIHWRVEAYAEEIQTTEDDSNLPTQ